MVLWGVLVRVCCCGWGRWWGWACGVSPGLCATVPKNIITRPAPTPKCGFSPLVTLTSEGSLSENFSMCCSLKELCIASSPADTNLGLYEVAMDLMVAASSLAGGSAGG